MRKVGARAEIGLGGERIERVSHVPHVVAGVGVVRCRARRVLRARLVARFAIERANRVGVIRRDHQVSRRSDRFGDEPRLVGALKEAMREHHDGPARSGILVRDHTNAST
ncbi:MAG TPA: hypothetical protein VN989_07895 [Casimicrobiaceae bacterium]|nr:hypothetical protein [Casimicrobiaceae bacterium]